MENTKYISPMERIYIENAEIQRNFLAYLGIVCEWKRLTESSLVFYFPDSRHEFSGFSYEFWFGIRNTPRPGERKCDDSSFFSLCRDLNLSPELSDKLEDNKY